LVGITVGFAGMLLLVLPERGAFAVPRGAGVIAVLISAFGWSVGTLRARYGRRHAHTLMASAQMMLAGGSALLLIALARGEVARLSWAAVRWQSALAFAYLTLIGSLVAFSAFGWLVARTSPALISTTAYVNPVVAVILGWLLLGERLSARALGGATLIIAAVIVMTLGRESLGWARRWLQARRA
jgi:drug/metabolite transporter (DMT)-like permease